MKNYLKMAVVGIFCSALILLPNSFSAQGKSDKHDKHGKHGNNGHKGGKDKIDIKIDFGKKGKGNDGKMDIKIKDLGDSHHGHGKHKKHGYYGFGHPGKGHAYGKYKWAHSPDIKKAKHRHIELLGVTVVLVAATVVFMNAFHPRLNNSKGKLDIRIKAGGLDIKVKQRREARIRHAEIKAKELDDLLVVSKLRLKVK
jgi:hypothetical protein